MTDEYAKRYAEELKKKYSVKSSSSEEQEFVQRQLESARKSVVQRYLTKEARERLNTVRVAKPELAQTIELAIVEAAQAGAIKEAVSEEQLKQILDQATSK